MTPLISPEDLATYLKQDVDRATAELAIAGASGVIRGYCGWNLTRVVETLTVDSYGTASINLPTLRLNDVTEVRIDGDPLDVDGYGWGRNGVLVMAGNADRWPAGFRRIEADVDHGYDPIPDEIRLVGCSLAGRLYSNPEGLSSKSSGDDSRVFGDTLSDVKPATWESLEVRLLHGYRLG